MTEREESGREQAAPEFGMPTAGRKPSADDAYGLPAAAEEPTFDLRSGAAEVAGTAGYDGEPTELLEPEPERGRVGAADGVPESAEAESEPEVAAAPRQGEPEMSDTSPDVSTRDTPEPANEESDLDRGPAAAKAKPGLKRPAPAGTLIWVLLALLGFTLVVQLRSNDADSGLSTARQEDLVRILSDLEARDSRLNTDIEALERSKQQLTSGVAGRETALEEAGKRSQELGLLAGTIAGRGPGLEITLTKVEASDVLNTVQELRGAGGEVMQINSGTGASVRIVASTYFIDASGGGIIADGEHLTGPFRLLVIGPPGTMSTALQIPGGVVASVKSGGGSVTMDSRSMVEVTAVRKATALQYARPVS
ncbi:uncharacterized protein YlxW (UPF0749 family) [Actinoplanes octamycinicus]|uniref:Uncharacterized protein YlxW (UPF0749 family) n=2 Tax=Actinoplanes octamycinicus TaxID=135948 RepID=A0A7W7MBQ0_9ACTN|nr:DUF881 domain-containing protein [Actinoplanes octamycinicus]MBB4744271.1 uncharacterized protein YlxW (UPF0749 family) [Actinoplanes octamycinicus]GIE56771.1 hypothetical protein Aoc01nite_21730 [Actinoplanes octamycinicus]